MGNGRLRDGKNGAGSTLRACNGLSEVGIKGNADKGVKADAEALTAATGFNVKGGRDSEVIGHDPIMAPYFGSCSAPSVVKCSSNKLAASPLQRASLPVEASQPLFLMA